MKNRIRVMIFITIISLLVTATGCWDRVEVEKLAIIRALAIDYLPDRKAPYLVTLAISLPADIAGGEGGGGGQPTQLFTGVGASIDIALEQIALNLSRRIFLSHTELIVVSEDLARHGLTHVLDFIVRHPQVRLSTYLLVATGMAQKTLTAPERLESSVSEEILNLISQAEQTPETAPLLTFEFMRNMVTPGMDPYTSLLIVGPPLESIIPELQNEQKPGGTAEGGGGDSGGGGGGGTGGGGGGGGEEQQDVLTLTGLAVFHSEKMAGKLDYVETRGFLWFLGKTQQAIITVEDPEDPRANVSLLVARVSSTITAHVQGDKVSFRVDVEEEGDIRSQSATTNVGSPEMIQKLNSAKAAVIKNEMEKALRRMQDLQCDLVGFGAALNRKDPKLFAQLHDRWPEVFSNLEVTIHVKADIRRTGQHSRPARPSR